MRGPPFSGGVEQQHVVRATRPTAISAEASATVAPHPPASGITIVSSSLAVYLNVMVKEIMNEGASAIRVNDIAECAENPTESEPAGPRARMRPKLIFGVYSVKDRRHTSVPLNF